ncbi:hypothetical protein SRHO_G00008980 [Serrasalmus rhombeus]
MRLYHCGTRLVEELDSLLEVMLGPPSQCCPPPLWSCSRGRLHWTCSWINILMLILEQRSFQSLPSDVFNMFCLLLSLPPELLGNTS